MQFLSGGTIGPCVKNLLFMNDHPRPTKQEFAKFISYLPNLTKFDIETSDHRTKITVNLKANAQHLIHLQDLKVDYYWEKKQIKRYFNCIYALRHSLEHVHIPEVKGFILPVLTEFKQLSHLFVTNTEELGGDPEFDMLSMLRLYPQLIDFYLRTDYQEPEITHDGDEYHLKLKSFKVELSNFTSWHINYMIRWFRLDEFHLVVTVY